MASEPSKTPHAISSHVSTSQCSPNLAAERAAILLGCFRRGDAADPDIYVGALTAVLAEYPVHVVRQVTDPRTGLPSRVQFLPTVKEVRDACDAIEAAERAREERTETLRRQFEERREFDLPPIENNATRSALCARYGVRAIPATWDAIDMARAAGIYGDGLQAHVEKILAGEVPGKAPLSPAGAVVERLRRKMQARMTDDELRAHYARKPAEEAAE